MEHKQIRAQGGTVHYWRSENRNIEQKTLFFLHGLTADHTMFDKQTGYFGGKYDLIAWDAPAHGRSRPYINFSYQDCADVIKEILCENDIDIAVLIGQSFGGYAAQSFITRYPEKVSAFVGIDTTPFGTAYYSRSDMWWLRQVGWMSYLYPLKALKKAVSEQVCVTKEGRANMMSMLEDYGKKELCSLMGIGYGGFLEDNRDISIKCPVLLIVGDRDKTGKVMQYNKMWSENTGFPLKIIKNAAHNSNYDNPTAVNEEIEEFISRI